jgi:hypothetical protein
VSFQSDKPSFAFTDQASNTESTSYNLTETGEVFFSSLRIESHHLQKSRRQLACAGLDWSERKPHLGDALGAALLSHFIELAWLECDLDSRALQLRSQSKRQFK